MAESNFIAERLALWEKLKEQKEQAIEQKEITIRLPDGKELKGTSGVSTPFSIINDNISKGLAAKALVASVNGELRDMNRPLEGDCELQVFTFDSPEGKKVFWHSSAHVLGEALEEIFQGNLCIGPPLDNGGFYYDIKMPGSQSISPEDFDKIKNAVNKVVKEKQTFERLVLSKEEALELFKYNKYKTEIINNKVTDICTAYRCGPLIDLCRGPHLPSTGHVKFFEVHKTSSAYWLGDAKNDSLQRVYGISFPDKKLMQAWKTFQEEAEKRNHRVIGSKQELFFMDPVTPGCVFLLPHGSRIYNKLQDLLRHEYRKRGFDEVVSPNIYNCTLWQTSGHWDHYKDNMFTFKCEDMDYGLKPMNCPGHCVMFKHRARSYRELPIRFADFGVLHRNEFSGALSGLTRVRRFQQDDAHIFCRNDQVEHEIKEAVKFMEHIYKIFGFTFSLELSTRPEKAIGDVAVWNDAEAQLQRVLEESGHPWRLNPGDGAFYGPKIDIHIMDAMQRSHQCATIQLDFQLPQRFGLEYQSETGTLERPVIIHRAIYGSLERFFGILIEHTAGKWPFWLSPRQIVIVPITAKLNDKVEELRTRLWNAGFYTDVDVSGKTLDKKLKLLAHVDGFYNYILVLGPKEVEAGTINVRTREKIVGAVKVERLIEIFAGAIQEFREPEFDEESIVEKPKEQPHQKGKQ